MRNLLNGIRQHSDIVFPLFVVLFTAWVALSQDPRLAAPIAAISTATFIILRHTPPRETVAEQLRPTLIAIGTALTALLWLLRWTPSVGQD